MLCYLVRQQSLVRLCKAQKGDSVICHRCSASRWSGLEMTASSISLLTVDLSDLVKAETKRTLHRNCEIHFNISERTWRMHSRPQSRKICPKGLCAYPFYYSWQEDSAEIQLLYFGTLLTFSVPKSLCFQNSSVYCPLKNDFAQGGLRKRLLNRGHLQRTNWD